VSLQVDDRMVDGAELGRLMEQTAEADKADAKVEIFRTPEGNFKFKLKIKPFSSYDHSRPPKPKKLLHGWLPERRTAALNAPGGNLKSTLIVDQAIETAKLKQMAIIVSAEDEADDYYGKFWSALKSPESRHHGQDIEALAEYIVVVDISGTGRKLSASPDNLGQRAEWVDDMIKDVKGMGKPVGFVAFETASRLCFGEDNNDFSAAITITDHVAMKLDCSCIISHHTAKFVAREKIVDNHSGRGGSALGDNTRSSVSMTKLDRQYKGIRQPMCSPDDIAEGRIIEMGHARNSFGPLMEPRYFRAKTGEGYHPIMEEIPSVKRGSQEEQDWREEFAKDQAGNAADMLVAYVIEAEDNGWDALTAVDVDDIDFRKQYLCGISRKDARKGKDELVASGRVVKVAGKRGQHTTFHMPDSVPVGSPIEVVTDIASSEATKEAPSSHYEENGKRYEGELLEDGKPRYIVEEGNHYARVDRLAELNAADY